MRVHYLQHVSFEGLGAMEAYLREQGHALSMTHLYLDEKLPDVKDFEVLIVMGGPMGIYDHEEHSWLVAEKEFIKQTIDAGKKILGICLGAQLIADVLGAQVYKGEHREIGWFDIKMASALNHSSLMGIFPQTMEVFHWHGDTFDIPAAALPLASSEACRNQGFIYEDRVVALQFHLETTPESAGLLIEHCGDELDGSRFVQSEQEIMADDARFTQLNGYMEALLKAMEL